MPPPFLPRVQAKFDQGLRATLSDLQPLVYDRTPPGDTDIADYVRAASSVRRWGSRLVIISDDTNAIAVRGEQTRPVLLPQGEGGRRTFGSELGNKKHKLDLEASVVLPDGHLLAFGSGSTTRRERCVLLAPDETVRMVDASALYAALRQTRAFAGSELNIEGAAIVGDVVHLFQRGNGAVVDGEQPLNATADLALPQLVHWIHTGGALPLPTNVVQYDLGRHRDVPWTFTDAACTRQGRIVFTAAAEASADTFNDGQVYGSLFGQMTEQGAEVAQVCDAEGRQLPLKIEGIEPDPSVPDRFLVVVDMDNPSEPALLGRLDVTAV